MHASSARYALLRPVADEMFGDSSGWVTSRMRYRINPRYVGIYFKLSKRNMEVDAHITLFHAERDIQPLSPSELIRYNRLLNPRDWNLSFHDIPPEDIFRRDRTYARTILTVHVASRLHNKLGSLRSLFLDLCKAHEGLRTNFHLSVDQVTPIISVVNGIVHF